MSIPTAHISSLKNDIAKTVIMPGDPLRSKMIAENFLTDVKLVNNVRGVQGYTGFYNGKKVTVMASGMGNPSMGIYSYELFKFYDVESIIRVGSIGGMKQELKIKDIVIATDVYTSTNYDNFYKNNGAGYITASEDLVKKAIKCAKKLKMKHHLGKVLCSDTFYSSEDEIKLANEQQLLGVEMEGAALYLNAKRLNKKGLVICTVSNNLITGEETSSEQRQNAFTDMIKLALEMA